MFGLLLLILLLQIFMAIVLCTLANNFYKTTDFSKEDADVRAATDRANAAKDAVNTARSNLPPRT